MSTENNINLNSLNDSEFGTICEAMGDWNNYGNESGFFTGNAMKNSPCEIESDKDYWYVINICMTVNYFSTQIAINAFNKETYIRNKTNKEWTTWTRLGNNCDAATLGGKYASDFATLNDISSINTLLNNKVDKIIGKKLSTNDFTDDYKTKLDNIQQGGEPNVQSDWNITDINSSAFIKNKPENLPANGGNADTLDGKHAVDFQKIMTYNTVVDFNNILEEGINKIMAGENTNAPTINWGTLIVQKSGHMRQLWFPDQGNDIYTRERVSSGWREWVKINNSSADNLKCPSFEGDLNLFTSLFSPIGIYDVTKVQNIPPQAIQTGSLSTSNVINIGVNSSSFNQYYIMRSGKIYMRTYVNWFESKWSDWKYMLESDGGSADNLKCPSFEGDLNNFKEMYSPRAISRSKLQNYPPEIYAADGTNPGGCDGGSIINLGLNKSQFYQFYFTQHQLIFQRTFVEWNNPQWTEWKNLRDANTLSGKYESYFAKATDINELKTRIKALEDIIKK